MKENLLMILPKPIKHLLLKEWLNPQGEKKPLIDLVIEDANMYDFQPEEITPCLHAAYYAYESTAYPEDWEDGQKLSIVFIVAYRSAFKLLSYGKYKATRTESGWMKYEKP